MIHLFSNEGYDESEVWCGEIAYWTSGTPTRDPALATCKRCLSEAAAFGEMAMVRLKELQ